MRLVGPHKLGALINELCQNVGLEMVTVIKPFVQALGEVRCVMIVLIVMTVLIVMV